MIKNKQRGLRNVPEKAYHNDKKIHNVNMGEYNRHGMQIFGANVQLARAIPNIADGFKPSARRCIYAAGKISHADRKMKKVNALVGDIIQIHPHGDGSIGQTLVGLSKPWELSYPLFVIDGNNGTPKGEPAAAGRYLEAMLSPYAIDCYFKEWDDNLVDMQPSYNPEYEEPTYMISRYPDLLLRPSTGFTFGMASNIPSYNLEEAFNATINLIRDPDYDPILIPDMPSDCVIMDEGNFPQICHEGKGSFKMRSEIEIDESKNLLVVESVPYKVKLDEVKTKINDLRKSCFSGLTRMFDGSNSYGVHLELEFANGTDLNVMKALLYKKTALESVFATQMTYVDMEQGKVILYNLKDIIQSWISNRRVIKRRSMINRLVFTEQRIHILNILIDICEDKDLLEKIIKLIKKSNKNELIEVLHKRYPDISSTQAIGICNMRISELSADSYKKYKEDRKECKEEIKDLNAKINNPDKIDQVIVQELKEAIKKYNQPRRCRVEKYDPDSESGKLVSKKDHILVFTKNGFVKKLSSNAKDIGQLNDGDEPITTIRANNRDSIIIFDSNGMVHTLKVDDLTNTDKMSKGVSLSTFIRVSGTIVSIIPKKELKDTSYFIFVTKNGMIKKTDCNKFAFKSSIIAMNLKDNDELVSVIHGDSNSNIIIYTKGGYGTRFNTKEVPATSRSSSGVIGIDLIKGDEVMGITKVKRNDTHIMVMTKKGYAKTCSLDSMETMKRRGDVLILTSIHEGDELLYVISCNENDMFLVIKKGTTEVLSFYDFPDMTRNHFGKKVVKLQRGEMIVRCLKLDKLAKKKG